MSAERRHLTGEEMSGWLAGDRGVSQSAHLARCAACSAQVTNMEQALRHLRISVKAWSEEVFEERAQVMAAESRLDGRVPPFFGAASGGPCAFEEAGEFELAPVRRGPVSISRARIYGVAVALALLLVFFTLRWSRIRERPVVDADADVILLNQVDAAVGQYQPSRMEPLLQLVPELRGSRASGNLE